METFNYTSGFLSPQELETHLYKESIDTIDRMDEGILTAAIDAAIQEAAGYLGAYNRERIFTATDNDRNALLLLFIKDIAVWHFINLCNAGVELELREKRYERAVAWLRQVQKGEVTPSLPRADEDKDGKPDPSTEYIYGSNPKRNQHF
jgi:phage gp36-like protein